MLKRLAILLPLFLLLAFSPQQDFKVSTGSIAFRSDASLELIKAQSNELKGLFLADKKQFAFIVNIKSFKGFNSPLQQEHFNENYLETNKYPTASFEGKIIEDVDVSKDGVYAVRAKGNLSIHGVVQERIIKSELTVKDGNISIKSNFTVLLADHNIPIPKVVHEKLASEIKVDIKADLIKK
ncbi:YceI family protein [Ferruginibacter sp. SUN106]|uniref:YceI family protein n=1 Tax=Ferruginibacter sp. SUN106 TaxID=2978348 RepID=UPI003D36B2B8